MPLRSVTTLIAAVFLLVSTRALAAQRPATPDFRHGQVLTADELNRVVGQVNQNTNALSRDEGGMHTVNCASGETIQGVMDQVQPGDTITITGTCTETVVVGRDGVTMDGRGSAVIDGGGASAAVILVKGHRNVNITGLTVQNGLLGMGSIKKCGANQAASGSASADLPAFFSPGYHCSNFSLSVPSRVRVRVWSMRCAPGFDHCIC